MLRRRARGLIKHPNRCQTVVHDGGVRWRSAGYLSAVTVRHIALLQQGERQRTAL